MCKGSDVLKVAAVAAAVYTGGTSLGLFGAEAAGAGAAGAAAAGEGFGAVAGSEALASGVGAAGGDAIGSLIASNAANWGMNVAPEIAALGGSAAELGALSQAGTYGTGGAVAPGAGGTAAGTTGGAAAGANTWLQTAKTVAPFVSAAGSALTGIAALTGAGARGTPTAAESPAPPGQSSISPDLYAALKRKNALLFGGSGPESTDLTKGSAGTGNLGKNALLGN